MGADTSIRSVTEENGLLIRARDGDVVAFEHLVRLHDDRMRALAYRMTGDRDAMDDVLQDAYVKAFRSMSGFRGDARFATWLHRIVATTCIDHARRRMRRAEDELAEESVPSGGRAGDVTADVVVRRTDLRRALDRLPPDQRVALLLVDGDGLSYHEAGDALGVPAGTVSSRISRARREMRALLEPRRPERPEDER